MTDAAAFAFRVVECDCIPQMGAHQTTCAKRQARELMDRNASAPNRVETDVGRGLQYQPHSTGAAAHRAYLEIASSPRRMRAAWHVRLYIGCELRAERKWRG